MGLNTGQQGIFPLKLTNEPIWNDFFPERAGRNGIVYWKASASHFPLKGQSNKKVH
jgi:hypothetical protein